VVLQLVECLLVLILILLELMEVEVEHLVLPLLLLLLEVSMQVSKVCPDFQVLFLRYLGCAGTMQLIHL
jgi:hypothetical protein